VVAAALVLGALPVRAARVSGLGSFEGPIMAWLARAPASCVMSSYMSGEPPLPDSKRVAYWVGHAMDGDEAEVEKLVRVDLIGSPKNWYGYTRSERVEAVYDPDSRAVAFFLGPTDMMDWGALAGETSPPTSAPPMRADLSRLTLGGNVHLGDSLATVRSALGLHALTPTNMAPACPGLGVVEVCDWNIAGCAPTPRPWYEGSHNIFGVIIFRNGRVAGFLWQRTWAAG
jgi:hypothetical protein